MAISNGTIAVAAVVIIASLGAETYLRVQDVRDLRQTIEAISIKVNNADTNARRADAAAARAVAKADQATALVAQAKEAGPAVQATSPPAAAGAEDIAAGRELAKRVCAVCHVVSPDQDFQPALRPPAPDFAGIANRPGTTEQSLRDSISAPHGKMPDPMLMAQQVTQATAYMMSLRDRR